MLDGNEAGAHTPKGAGLLRWTDRKKVGSAESLVCLEKSSAIATFDGTRIPVSEIAH
jgi:hypothetical protein